MLGSNMSALQGFAGSDATSTALSFATGSVVRQPSLHVKQRRLFSDSVRRRRQSLLRMGSVAVDMRKSPFQILRVINGAL